MVRKENQSEYYKKYNKKALRRISLALSLEKDKDIIEAIEKEGSGNLQAGVRSLIREAIRNRDIV